MDNLAFLLCIREPDADAQYDGALMYGADGDAQFTRWRRAAVGCERARVYKYPRPALSAGREKGAIVCGA